MNALAYVFGGAMLPLIIVLPVLALVRPRRLVEAGCLIASLLLLVFAMEVRGGVRFDGMMIAEAVVAFTISMGLYCIAKKTIRAIVNNGESVPVVMQHDTNHVNEESKRQKIVLLGSGVVALLGTILSVTNLMGGSGKGSIFQFSSESQKQQRNVVIEQPSDICYILINNEKIVKIAGELDGYVTTQYDKDGFKAMVYFKKGTSEKGVREYWWTHKEQVLKTCGFVR